MKIKRVFLLAVIALIFPFIANADEAITSEKLKAAYKDYLACQKEGNYTEIKKTRKNPNGFNETLTVAKCNEDMDDSSINMDEYIDTTNKIIYMDFEDDPNNKIAVEYAITNVNNIEVVTFTKVYEIKNGETTYEQYKNYNMESLYLYLGFVITSHAKGVPIEDSMTYLGSLLLDEVYNALFSPEENQVPKYIVIPNSANKDDYEPKPNQTIIFESEFPDNAVDYAKDILGTDPRTFNNVDGYMSFIMVPSIFDLTTSYKYSNSLGINSNSDFSSLIGFADRLLAEYPDDGSSHASQDPVDQIVNDDDDDSEPAQQTSAKDTSTPASSTSSESTPTSAKDTSTTDNSKTGAFLSAMPITVLLSLGIAISVKNKSVFMKI